MTQIITVMKSQIIKANRLVGLYMQLATDSVLIMQTFCIKSENHNYQQSSFYGIQNDHYKPTCTCRVKRTAGN